MVHLNTTGCERVLVVENEPDAGPEMFQHWLSGAGLRVELWRPYAGHVLPSRLEGAGLLVLGGEMGALDDDKAPWLAQVRAMLEEATAQGRPVLGICLGAQMLAAACGGRVEPARSGGELGLDRIELNDEAHRDRLFAGIAPPVEVVQWHNDEITELPPGAVLLASSPRCAVQAFRIGERAWGVASVASAETRLFALWRGFAERFAAVMRQP
ncbi:MAG: type 1 glutamine amidotransferase [Acidimicrobiales bacterium]